MLANDQVLLLIHVHCPYFYNKRKRNSFCAVRGPPFCNINSKMASGRWLAKVLGNYKAAERGIHSSPVHAMLSLIYIVLLFPPGRLFSVLCARRFLHCSARPWEHEPLRMTSARLRQVRNPIWYAVQVHVRLFRRTHHSAVLWQTISTRNASFTTHHNVNMPFA